MKTIIYFLKIPLVIVLITVGIPEFLAAQEEFSTCLTIQNELNFESNEGGLNGETGFEEQNEYLFKVYLHILRRGDGSDGQPPEVAFAAFELLQQQYNQHNIYFDWNCEIDYIDSDFLFDFPFCNAAAIDPENDFFDYDDIHLEDDGINIYIFDENVFGNGGWWKS